MRCLAALILCALCGCSSQAQQTAIDRLQPCATDEGPTDAYCGTLSGLREPRDPARSHDRSEDRRAARAEQRRRNPTRCSFSPAGRDRAPPQMARGAARALPPRPGRPRHRPRRSARHRQVEPAQLHSRRRLAGRAERADEDASLERLKQCLARLRRRPAPLHDQHRDGRSRRRPRASRLRHDQHLRRLVRHARRARLPAPARADASAR